MITAVAALAELLALALTLLGAGWGWLVALLAHVAAAWTAGRALTGPRRDERLLVVALVLALSLIHI